MSKGLVGLAGALGFSLLASWANAHLGLTVPVSRYGSGVLKQGPCGVAGGERTDKVTVFEPGETILVSWEEYVDHPGHYRIAFDSDGDDDFVDPASMEERYSNDTVLLDGIEDESGTNSDYEISVQLPNIECERCTLQVIQVMYDKPPYVVPGNDIYYQCADLALRCPEGASGCGGKGAGGYGGGAAGVGGYGDGAAGGGGDGGGDCSAGAEADENDGCKEGGSCSLSPGATGGAEYAWGYMAATFAALVYRRRPRLR